MKLLVAALPALFLAGAATAQTESSSGAPTAPSAQGSENEGREAAEPDNPRDRQVCRMVEASESRRRTRVCMTARQWRDQDSLD